MARITERTASDGLKEAFFLSSVAHRTLYLLLHSHADYKLWALGLSAVFISLSVLSGDGTQGLTHATLGKHSTIPLHL
jgi:hypothetical protein